jgi:hypothetical protein
MMNVHADGCLRSLSRLRRTTNLTFNEAIDDNGCGPGKVFVCVGCGLRAGYCRGATDDMPEHCDECWNDAHHRCRGVS